MSFKIEAGKALSSEIFRPSRITEELPEAKPSMDGAVPMII